MVVAILVALSPNNLIASSPWDNHGALEFIVVEPGLSAEGFVEVTPVEGTLVPGQLVVVGYENYNE